MKYLSVFLNHTMPAMSYGLSEDLVLSSHTRTSIEGAFATKVAGFGAISGVLVAVLIDYLFHFEYKVFKKKVKIKMEDRVWLQKFFILITLMLVLPFVLSLLLLASFYKLICSVIIKRKDKHFAGFLNSFDVFWSLEDDATKSIISVLGVIESKSSQDLVDHIREKLQNIIQNSDAEKIFYRRNEEFGFYYWRKCCYIDINQYVRIVDVSNSTELNISDLEEIMTEIAYQPLPFNDEGLFQILITNQKLKSDNKNDEYGVIFRIHHAVGDGVALIEFLCESLADRENESNVFCMPDAYKSNSKKTPSDLMEMIMKLCKMPGCLVNGILRVPDRTSLHGPTLIGKKLFKWTDSDENLFDLVKDIKKHSEDLNCSDILATSLSCGLRDYFIKEIDPAPNTVAVILPVRFPQKKTGVLKLENNFTVSILDLPIGSDIGDVRRSCNGLRESADPLTNFYFLKICSIFPKEILFHVFNSNQATMVFSNMPGPKVLSICGGVMKSLVFFIPNKGNTGLGITALCYNGVLRFGAMADSALVSSSDELATILNGMVKEIKRLHKEYVS
ncbi:putative diacyglycerol O-acyltransferase MT0231 [Vanessa atalanta]|uniref:putative diacyglycerol O-acyltransferase MT0231 n=1 Tax=Vanessa atalanta TaxID=42275 RepID=UPI001FCDFEF3|nr:putative diacyglycerol O-acyltransferase MT0231 [Vanessa atalanta]